MLVAALATSTTANDLSNFEKACPKARTFLLKDVPPEADGDAVLAALCPCLKTGFETYSQDEIDALTADLRTGSSFEAQATYRDYLALQSKASDVLGACFKTPDVLKLMPPKR
jgi:hypothetical protein